MNMKDTHCKRGHVRSVHMRINAAGEKVCVKCKAINAKRHAEKRRDELRAIREAVWQDLI
jgi:hypothetical protein